MKRRWSRFSSSRQKGVDSSKVFWVYTTRWWTSRAFVSYIPCWSHVSSGWENICVFCYTHHFLRILRVGTGLIGMWTLSCHKRRAMEENQKYFKTDNKSTYTANKTSRDMCIEKIRSKSRSTSWEKIYEFQIYIGNVCSYKSVCTLCTLFTLLMLFTLF